MKGDGRELVASVVYQMQRRKMLLFGRGDNDIEDYYQVGYIGYLNALRLYDERKGEFKAFAWRKISGALLDWNRELVSRRYRPVLISMDDDRTLWELPDLKLIDAEEYLSKKQHLEEIVQLIQQLHPGQRLVLEEYYFKNRNMKQIANDAGLTESRICQIHGAAIDALQALVAKRPRKEWDAMRESKRKRLFTWLCSQESVTIESVVLASGLSKESVAIYMSEFCRALPGYILKREMEDGKMSYVPRVPAGQVDAFYRQVAEFLNDKRANAVKRKEQSPVVRGESLFERTSQVTLPPDQVEFVGLDKLQLQPKQQVVELVVKLRIQIQIEQI